MLNRPIVIISAPMEFVSIPESVSDNYIIYLEPYRSLEELKSSENLKKAHAWIVSPCPTYQIDDEIVKLMPRLKIIVTPSTGVNHINIKELTGRGIEVKCLLDDKDYLSITASSEFSFLLIMAAVRRFSASTQAPIEGHWRNIESELRGRELSCLKLGLYGCGRIGSNVARYASVFGMDVTYYDPYITKLNLRKAVSIQYLFENNDVVLLCPYLNDETRSSIDSKLFNQKTSNLILVNTSRGDVVNESSIAEAIHDNQLGAYYTDVLQGEIDGSWQDSPLLSLAKSNSNVCITPHIAGLTSDSESKAQLSAIKMVINFFGSLA